MAIIKCKMCGGDLNIAEGESVAECEYCGSRQTVPNQDSEKKLTLFGRANRLRLACEFDKAAGVYESIVADFPEEAEAYWGLVLCRYGIEYVDDPRTGKKIPTCHRSSFDSVMEDQDFEQACENADAVARKVYREEAKAIEELRRGILEVSGKEAPYDIFICYKETDDKGDRTVDSVIAQDVYDALTEKGYRVFFSRISLEDKLGTEYEPYIFAALNSAKIMLVFGTDYEYFNAVWVKNEWSRFLALITGGQKKVLIPCYKNVDAYDMPKEFTRLQAQDMGKVGAIQDLLRGISKLLPLASAGIGSAGASQKTAGSGSALVRRGYLFLEDDDFSSASSYFERALDEDPENSDAYIGKILLNYHLHNRGELANKYVNFDNDKDYQKALRFANSENKKWLENIKTLMEKRKLVYRLKLDLTQRREKLAAVEATEDLKTWTLEVTRYPDDWVMFSYDKNHYVGLRSDGTVVSTGDNEYGQREVSVWRNVVSVAAVRSATFGLRSTGDVLVAGSVKYDAVRRWTDITTIEKIEESMVGIRSDGSVLVTPKRESLKAMDNWQNVSRIVSLGMNAFSVCRDGTVLTNINSDEVITGWDNLIKIGTVHYPYLLVGLCGDGTVIGADFMSEPFQVNLTQWLSPLRVGDLIDIEFSSSHIVGLRANGKVVAVGENNSGECDVDKWENVVEIFCGLGWTAGVCADGSFKTTHDITKWKCGITEWHDLIAVSGDTRHLFGLRSDGVLLYSDKSQGLLTQWDWDAFTRPYVIQLLQTRLSHYQSTADRKQRQMVILEREAELAQRKAEEVRQLQLQKEKANHQHTLEELKKLCSALQYERANLKGPFAGKRRRELEVQINKTKERIKNLSSK